MSTNTDDININIVKTNWGPSPVKYSTPTKATSVHNAWATKHQTNTQKGWTTNPITHKKKQVITISMVT